MLIWYTGHGKKDTGDWPMKDGFLRFQDIYDLYKKEFRGRPLYVITDCCYSGAWVTDCAKLLDADGMSCGHQAKRNGVYIKVFASCLPNEPAFDQYYVKHRGVRKHIDWKDICFAEHRRLGKNETHCQHTLGIDFTRDDLTMCLLDLNGECTHGSTWTEHVTELIQRQSSRKCYLV